MPSPIVAHTVPWPAADVERYVAKGYWLGTPLGSLLREVADRCPDAPGLIDAAAGLRLSHRELADRADAAAARLLDLGLRAGDRIVVQLPNGWEFVVLTLACLRAGVVPVMALPAHRRTELAYLAAARRGRRDRRAGPAARLRPPGSSRTSWLTRCAPAPLPWHVLVAGDEIAPGSVDLRALCAPRDQPSDDRARLDAPPTSRDVAVFLLSGGTTGLPKLIARTHDDYAYNAVRSAEVSGVDADTGLPGGPARRAQLPAGLPGHPRHAAGRRAGGHAALARSRAAPSRRSPPKASRTPRSCPRSPQRWLDHAAEHGADQLAIAARAAGRRGPAGRRGGPPDQPGVWAPRCSRCSAWPRACSTTPGSTTPTRSSAPRRAGRCAPTTRCGWSTSSTTTSRTASPARC